MKAVSLTCRQQTTGCSKVCFIVLNNCSIYTNFLKTLGLKQSHQSRHTIILLHFQINHYDFVSMNVAPYTCSVTTYK